MCLYFFNKPKGNRLPISDRWVSIIWAATAESDPPGAFGSGWGTVILEGAKRPEKPDITADGDVCRELMREFVGT